MELRWNFETHSFKKSDFTGGGRGYDPSGDASLIKKNLRVIGDILGSGVAFALGQAVLEILRESQPHVPYYTAPGKLINFLEKELGVPKAYMGLSLTKSSTGALRESGRAYVLVGRAGRVLPWAKGLKDGTISKKASSYRNIGQISRAKRIEGVVEYSDPKALWAHEELLDSSLRDQPPPGGYLGRKPDYLIGKYVARTPGTGPKYLSNAFMKKQGRIRTLLNEAIKMTNSRIKRGKKINRRAKGAYEVDIIEILPR